MAKQLDEWLRCCTVKITLPSAAGWGTGFFVAPDLILTCAHVVKAATASIVTVFYPEQAQSYSACFESLPAAHESVDLALLRLQASIPSQPCVYLNAAIALNDRLYSYGYPDDYPDGAFTTFESEALTGGNSFIKVKGGWVRRGMSGSPLLNQRTGSVCGIIKFTHDRALPTGGGAIPVDVILEQFPQLRSLQQAFHQQDARWSDAVKQADGVEAPSFSGPIAVTQTNLDGTNYQVQVGPNSPTYVGETHIYNYAAPPPSTPPKYGVPFPRVRLPDNFVPRPDALNAVKQRLLAADDRTLVVSAIAGLGGLGKSVLATAVVLDEEVRSRFADGILWVTLGQSPDLQTMLGEWIRELDKSRESFSATTLESASRYLDTLLAERRMLLVVDDVWNAAHAEWFRVGGAGCRVLVTTREAQIDGAAYYPLDLMSEVEAVDLVRQKLEPQWRSEQEAEVKAFAKVLGYLPLALDLATNQVRDGLTWMELRSEFEVERRAVALEVLDSSEAWERLEAEQQRKYSLRACFNLSLKRLQPLQLQQFAWLGVLPEDATLDARVASVLWSLPLLQAKKWLLALRGRSFLTDGVATFEGERTYRVHDLMHDMAHNLIEAGTLELKVQNPQLKTQNLPLAHRHFLENYRERAADHRWDQLPNDAYIHRHLTWHMEQADWADEIHALMAMSDTHGCNAWFEACDKLGQPAIFVEDVARGWRLAEQDYTPGNGRSIVLQCRYALMTATLNSLLGNLPGAMMAAFVKRNFWTVEQAWAYVEAMQDETQIVAAIQALAPHLYKSKSLFQMALGKARAIQGEYNRAAVLIALAQVDGAYFDEALAIARAIQDEDTRADMLIALTQVDEADFAKLLVAAQAIQNESKRAAVLIALARVDGAYFDEALAIARAIQGEYSRAAVLIALARVDGVYFDEALAAARAIQNESWRASVLIELTQMDIAYFNEALAATRAIKDKEIRTDFLRTFAQIDGADFTDLLAATREILDEDSLPSVLVEMVQVDGANFTELLATTHAIQDESWRTDILIKLAQVDGANLTELLATARAIQDEDSRAAILIALAQVDGADFTELLAAAREIQDEDIRAAVLRILIQVDGADFTKLLAAVQAVIQDESWRADILIKLAQVDGANLTDLLAAARAIQDESWRADILIKLVQVDGTYSDEALAAARAIQDEFWRADILIKLVQVDGTYFDEALAAARAIQDGGKRASVLSALAQVDGAYFDEALAVARAIQDESWRADILIKLSQVDGADFTKLLAATRAIQDEGRRASILSALAQVDGADFTELLAAARAIQAESWRAYVLRALAQVNGAYFEEALAVAQAIQSEDSRASVLRALAQVGGANYIELMAAARAIHSKSWRAYVLSALARVNGTYFNEALAATRVIQDEDKRVSILSALVQVDGADFTELLATARAIQSEYRRADILSALAQQAPPEHMQYLHHAISELTHKPTRARTLSALLLRLPLNFLPYSDWQTHLHTLAHRTRSDLMQDLGTLYPAILHLGGETAMRGVVGAMREICEQWP